MIIQVTQDHINRGWRFASASCPIALAMLDAGLTGASAGVSNLFWGYPRKMVTLPTEVKAWILAFDRKQHVEPFEFDLDVESQL